MKKALALIFTLGSLLAAAGEASAVDDWEKNCSVAEAQHTNCATPNATCWKKGTNSFACCTGNTNPNVTPNSTNCAGPGFAGTGIGSGGPGSTSGATLGGGAKPKRRGKPR